MFTKSAEIDSKLTLSPTSLAVKLWQALRNLLGQEPQELPRGERRRLGPLVSFSERARQGGRILRVEPARRLLTWDVELGSGSSKREEACRGVTEFRLPEPSRAADSAGGAAGGPELPRAPVKRNWMVTPNEYKSDWTEYRPRLSTSGGMKAGSSHDGNLFFRQLPEHQREAESRELSSFHWVRS